MVITSKIDQSQFKVLTLPNKIKVLLVSNKNNLKSSCGLAVRVGSLDEPVEFPGLAHFLEHMLFLGTEKYPEENGFSDFLGLHGGASNAYTASEETVYYFDIDSAYFLEATDRFAQFFTSPLLAKESVDREVLAVNSEYLNTLNSGPWRKEMLLKELMLDEVPQKRFNCGNSETLQKPGVLEAVREFEKNFYSSDLMTLVVCGSDSLEQLERIAELFSGIKNKTRSGQVQKKIKEKAPVLFKPEIRSHVVQYKPLDDSKQLYVHLQLPRLVTQFRVNPLEYIDFLLTTKEPHGLLSKLKKEKLGFGVELSYEHSLEGTGVDIAIDLTERGVGEYRKVLDLLHQHILSVPVEENEYLRLKRIRGLDFEYSDMQKPIELARDLPALMHDYPVENVFNYSYTFENFDQILIRKTLMDIADTSNWIVLLAHKDCQCDRKEQLYGVEYAILQSYTPAGVVTSTGYEAVVHETLGVVSVIEANPQRFYQHVKYETGEIHRVFDCKFRAPKAELSIFLCSPDFKRNLPAVQIFFTLAEEQFAERFATQLTNSQVSFNVCLRDDEVEVSFTGFSSKLFSLAFAFFDRLSGVLLDNFEVVKHEVEELYIHKTTNSPYRRTFEIFKSKLFGIETAEELVEKTRLVQKKDIKPPCDCYVRILAVGNTKFDDITDLFDNITNLFKKTDQNTGERSLSPLTESKYTFETNDKFNNGITLFFNIAPPVMLPEAEINYEVDDETTCTTSCQYLQDCVVGQLICQLAHENFFNQLRTIEQLGYIVFSSVQAYSSARYLVFTVQSEKPVEFLEKRINEFVCYLKDWVRSMDDDEFEDYKKSVSVDLLQPLISLEDLGELAAEQLHTGKIDLNERKRMAQVLAVLKQQDVADSKIFENYVKVHSVRLNK